MNSVAVPLAAAHADPVERSREEELLESAEVDALVDRFGHRVAAFARRIASRYGLAPLWYDDLVSAGYWGLLKALRNRRPDAHDHELSAYVSRRIEGCILDEVRRVIGHLSSHAGCDPMVIDEGVQDEAAGDLNPAQLSDEDPEVQADRSARWRFVERSLAHLDEDQRRLLLTLASGHSLAEIARQDGSTPSRLQGQLQRVARRVRAESPELRRILRNEI